MSIERLARQSVFAALLVAVSTLTVSFSSSAADVEIVEGQPDAVGLGTLDARVREPVSTGRTVYQTQTNTPNNYQADTQTELLLQLQALQDEVRVLRGQLEEQSYLLQKMQQQSKSDYLEFDRRLSEGRSREAVSMTNGSAQSNSNKPLVGDGGSRTETVATQTVATTAAQTPIAAVTKPMNSVNAPEAVPENVQPSENGAAIGKTDNVVRTESRVITTSPADDEGREAYKAAYNMVKAREFDEARVAMIAFIDQHPNNTFVPNAHFWLGELYYHDSDLVRSRDQFAVLIDAFPEHRKVPDAKFKMAKVIHQLGDAPRAKRLLQTIVKEHGTSRVAKPAREYLENSL